VLLPSSLTGGESGTVHVRFDIHRSNAIVEERPPSHAENMKPSESIENTQDRIDAGHGRYNTNLSRLRTPDADDPINRENMEGLHRREEILWLSSRYGRAVH
jgi:hypothetical protein